MSPIPTAGATLPTSPLGTGGPMVSRLGFGTMTFGAETDEDEAFRQLDLFVDHGGTFIDTADVYGNGLSEGIIGKWARGRGGGRRRSHSCDQGTVRAAAGKPWWIPPQRHPVRRGELETPSGRCDRCLFHPWLGPPYPRRRDPGRAGRPGQGPGRSTTSPGPTCRAGSFRRSSPRRVPRATRRRWPSSPSTTCSSAASRSRSLPCCLEEGIAVTPWSPLGGGWLTGKYSADTRPSGATRLGGGPRPGRGGLRPAQHPPGPTRSCGCFGPSRSGTAGRRPMSRSPGWRRGPAWLSVLLGARTADQLAEDRSRPVIWFSTRPISRGCRRSPRADCRPIPTGSWRPGRAWRSGSGSGHEPGPPVTAARRAGIAPGPPQALPTRRPPPEARSPAAGTGRRSRG